MSGMVFEAQNKLFEHQVSMHLCFSFLPLSPIRNYEMTELLVRLINTTIVVLWHVRVRAHYPSKNTRTGL